MIKKASFNQAKHFKKIHFKRRMLERYDLLINSKDIFKITYKCFSDYLYCIEESSSRRLVLIEYKGKIIYVVFDVRHRTPITAKPRHNFFDLFRLKGE